jgi:hypothetical protein
MHIRLHRTSSGKCAGYDQAFDPVDFCHSRSTLIEVEKEGKLGGLLGADLIARGGLLRPSFAHHIALPRGIPQTRYWDMVRPLVAFVRNVCYSTFQFIRQGMRLAKTALNTRKRQEG